MAIDRGTRQIVEKGELLAAFGQLVELMNLASSFQTIANLLTGQLPENQELIRLSYQTPADDETAIRSQYAADLSDFAALGGSLDGGQVDLEFRPSVNLVQFRPSQTLARGKAAYCSSRRQLCYFEIQLVGEIDVP